MLRKVLNFGNSVLDDYHRSMNATDELPEFQTGAESVGESSEGPFLTGVANQKELDQDPIFEISDVIDYLPSKGYLVHWNGFPEAKRSWQKASSMPSAFKGRMRELRKLWKCQSDRGKPKAKQAICKFPIQSKQCREQLKPKEERLYLIDEVLKFDKVNGYLVSWVGFGAEHNSWQHPNDMPEFFRSDMERLRASSLSEELGVLKQKSDKLKMKPIDDMDKTSVYRLEKQNKQVVLGGRISKKDDSRSDMMENATAVETIKTRFIHSVLEFSPTRGVLVHWKNLPQKHDSWLPEEQVGESFRYQILLAKERYVDNMVDASRSASPAISTPDYSCSF